MLRKECPSVVNQKFVDERFAPSKNMCKFFILTGGPQAHVTLVMTTWDIGKREEPVWQPCLVPGKAEILSAHAPFRV